ncbi:MAG: gamma-glutamyltransferase [Acidobacteria bacterium]|nr:gamma-glutamyltransferase [Acidobacteriota bacterium]
MVVTAHYLATEAGVRVLEEGGNAVDAAVAASLALAVCEPAGSGLGGMAVMLIHDPSEGRTRVLSGPCRAPGLATPGALARVHRYRGHAAVAVPAYLAVIRQALARFGRLSEARVIAPAIALAEEGFPLTGLQSALAAEYWRPLRRGNFAHLFLDDRGKPRPTGSLLRQPALARTLRRLETNGFEDFYRGGIARTIAEDMEVHGGFVRLVDLATAADPRETDPLVAHFEDRSVATAGPPAGGLTLLHMLRLLDAAGNLSLQPEDPQWSLLMARIVRRARTDRRRYRLRIGAEDVSGASDLLDPLVARDTVGPLVEDLAGTGETSHLCTMDANGLAVSLTQSIERSFGAAVGSAELGILFNGYLRAFKVKNQRHPHYLAPGAPARSNAAPTIVSSRGEAQVLVGSTGSERAASGILQVLARLRHQAPFDAAHAPRLHCTPEGEVLLEADRFSERSRRALTGAGLRLTTLDPYSFRVGGLQLIVRENGRLTGVSEPRRDGAAGGPRRD